MKLYITIFGNAITMQKLEGQLPTWRKWDSPIHPPQAPTPLAVLCTHWAHFSGCSLLPVFKGRPNFGSSFGAERVDFKTFGVVYFRFRPKVAVTFSVIFQIRQLWCQISAGIIRSDTVSRCQIRGGAGPPWFNRLISTDTTYIFYGMRWPGTNINKDDRP